MSASHLTQEDGKKRLGATAITSLDMTFINTMEKKIKVCKNNLVLNCILSSLILVLNILPYILPWFSQESSVSKNLTDTEPSNKNLYISLFHVWVPQMNQANGQKMKMAEYIDAGCPAMNKTIQTCSSYHSYQLGAIGYIVLKICSQLIHILNIYNAIRVIRTSFNENRGALLY